MSADAIKVILDYFCTKHSESLGMKYLIAYGKDHKTIKEITKVYSLQDTIKMIDAFFEQLKKDEFLKQTGASVGIFKTQLPKLVMDLSKSKGPVDNNKGKL